MTRVLLVDNHDSFTFNIAHLVAAAGGGMPDVMENDAAECPSVSRYTHVIIGPGPGTPNNPADTGHSVTLYREALEKGIPVLGVCLGMQLMAVEHGGAVGHAPEPMHGRENLMSLTDRAHSDPVLGALPQSFTAVRYHSLAVLEPGNELEVMARASDGTAQAVRHRSRRVWGVQFHPESIRSEAGVDLMRAFLKQDRTATHTIVASDWKSLESTPEDLFAELFAHEPTAVWLDSGSDDPRSRYSYMGVPERVLEHRVGQQPLMERIAEELDRYRLDAAGLAIATECGGFALGFVGYIGYGIGEETLGVPGLASQKGHIPDAALPFLESAVVIDHEGHRVRRIALSTLEKAFAAAPDTIPAVKGSSTEPPVLVTDSEIEFAVDFRHCRDKYLSLIDRCHRFIEDGESYELCLTNEGRLRGEFDPFEVYRRLRALARVPYGAFLKFPKFAVASASPERFLEVSAEGQVESRPIKGTRPRAEGAADHALKQELLESEKDRAENLMIVDLVRNDLSRVCAPGSVHVPSIYAVESFPSVHQLISTVRGTLGPGNSAVDALEASFPGGSMTGAPKLRTVQLLADMEAGERGVYSGAIGWISLNGALSLSIVIRTAVIDEHGASFGVGGAITRLSNAADEYREILTKARTVVSALSGAERPRR